MFVEVDFEFLRVGLSVKAVERRLGIEQVNLAGTAVLEQADHRLGLAGNRRRRRGTGG
ncbi:MAG: hypothetical protein R3C10_27560 [Pirellulales bacterium]